MSPKPRQTITLHFASRREPRGGNALQHLFGNTLPVVIALYAGICGSDDWIEVRRGAGQIKVAEAISELPPGHSLA